MYSLYGQPRYFKLKRKYQRYDPCLRTIFLFLMTMLQQNIHQVHDNGPFTNFNCSLFPLSSLLNGFRTLWFFILFLFFIILDSVIKCRGTFESKINLWLFLYVTCIKLCEWSKNGKILLLDPGSFYLLEPFASKESISIVILIFFHVDLNFLHLKVAVLEGATKSYLTHYLCVVIIFYHNDLDKSAFMKLQLRLSVFYVFFFYS